MPMSHRDLRRPSRRLLPALVAACGFVLAALWLGLAAPRAQPAPPAAPRFLNLILSAAGQGEMLPCGRCMQKAGGLGRRATIIAASRDTADHVLVADGGDLFLPGGADPQVDAFLVGMLARLGYTVFGVGEEDLKRGKPYLDSLVAPHAGLDWVSANILDARSRQRIFKPYVLRQVGDRLIGFTSVLEPELLPDSLPGIAVEPCREGLMRIMPALRNECDLVVCFAHARYREVRQISADVEGVDIVVASHKARVENYPQRIGYARQVYFAGSKGRFLNWANVRLDEHGADPVNGRTFYLLDAVPEDSAVVRDVLAFLGTSEPPGAGEGPGAPEEENAEPEDLPLPAAPGGDAGAGGAGAGGGSR
jgi:2',3'-cyclic-nucleotide 2'-phosphodiesterase (5'-nucleotidase family)